MNGKFIFSGKFIFRWRGHLIGVDSALMAEGGGRGEEAHGVGGTLLMSLPTRGNPGLCCNRIKKKHELQYALENLQEKDLNFTRKGTSSQINFHVQHVYLMVDFKPLLDLGRRLGVWNPGLWAQGPQEKVSYFHSESILSTLECSLG